MDNYDATSYAQVALINLQKNNTPITHNMVLSESSIHQVFMTQFML